MHIRTSLFIAAFVLLFLVYLFHLISKKEIELRNTLPWFFLGIIILILISFPNLAGVIATLIGVYEPVNLIFFSGFCLLLYLVFTLTRIVSKQSVQIRHLVQKIALEKKKNER